MNVLLSASILALSSSLKLRLGRGSIAIYFFDGGLHTTGLRPIASCLRGLISGDVFCVPLAMTALLTFPD